MDIVLPNADVRRLRKSASKMYFKYMKEKVLLEINITCASRRHYHALEAENYASLKPMDWTTLYDGVISEMLNFIFQSYTRMICRLQKRE